MTARVADLKAAGILNLGFDPEGGETWTLTEKGAAPARSMAWRAGDDALELLSALLDAAET
jgi:hypothetical protein